MDATGNVEPLLLDAKGAARLLAVGRTHLYGLLASGRLPRPVRLGRAVRWRRDELEAWTAAGCPSAERWQALQNAPSGRR